jgi:hypothetical protein
MKKIILFFALLFASSVSAQIVITIDGSNFKYENGTDIRVFNISFLNSVKTVTISGILKYELNFGGDILQFDQSKVTKYLYNGVRVNPVPLPWAATGIATRMNDHVSSGASFENLAETQGKYGAVYVRDTFERTGDFFCVSFINLTAVDSLITDPALGWDNDTIVADTFPAGQFIYGNFVKFKAADTLCRVVLYKNR